MYVTMSMARDRMPELVESSERVVITRNGLPAAVLLGIDDFRALQAAQTLLADPEALGALLDTHRRVQAGDTRGMQDLAADASPSRATAKAGR